MINNVSGIVDKEQIIFSVLAVSLTLFPHPVRSLFDYGQGVPAY